jgi:hypothetical protein
VRKFENQIFCTRLDFERPYQMCAAHGEMIQISMMPGAGGSGYMHTLTRKDARLLAKRINACLDATVKK